MRDAYPVQLETEYSWKAEKEEGRGTVSGASSLSSRVCNSCAEVAATDITTVFVWSLQSERVHITLVDPAFYVDVDPDPVPDPGF